MDQELPTLPGHLFSPTVVLGVRVTQSFDVYEVFCRLLSVLFWQVYYLSFELRLPRIPHWYLQPFALHMLSWKLLNQGFIFVKLKSSLRKLFGRHHDLVDHYVIVVSQITTDIFHFSQTLPGPFLIHDLSPVCNYINTTGVTSEVGTSYPSGTPVLSEVRVMPSLVLCVCFVDRYLSFCTLSFGHCVVCSSSSIYGFWLLLWYLPILHVNQAISV